MMQQHQFNDDSNEWSALGIDMHNAHLWISSAAQLNCWFRSECTAHTTRIWFWSYACVTFASCSHSFLYQQISTAILHMRTAQSAVRNQSAQSLRFAHCNCICNCNLRLLARCETTIFYAFISRFSFLCSSRTERNVPLEMIHRQQIEYFTKKIWEKNQQKEARLICHKKNIARYHKSKHTHHLFSSVQYEFEFVCKVSWRIKSNQQCQIIEMQCTLYDKALFDRLNIHRIGHRKEWIWKPFNTYFVGKDRKKILIHEIGSKTLFLLWSMERTHANNCGLLQLLLLLSWLAL